MGISTKDLIRAFNPCPNIRKIIAKKFTEEIFSKIEKLIDETTEKRKMFPAKGASLGYLLFKNTNKDIAYIKKLLGTENLEYQMIINKLSLEVLQCAIDFFNALRDSEKGDPGEDALKVIKYVKNIGATGQTLSRINENYKIIQDWVLQKPERDKLNSVKEEFEFIDKLLNNSVSEIPSIKFAKKMIKQAEPKLEKIRKVMGSYNQAYLDASSAVVLSVQNIIINLINAVQEVVNSVSQRELYAAIERYKRELTDALLLMYKLDKFRMTKTINLQYKKKY